jgi:hypothetical protein
MEICGKLKVYIIKYHHMSVEVQWSSWNEKIYRVSTVEQLKPLLIEVWGWSNIKVSGWFNKINDVSTPFRERELKQSEIKMFAEKLNKLSTAYEQRQVINQFALGTLINTIGTTYSFSHLKELEDALNEQGVIYPKSSLEQANSTFVQSFGKTRYIAKDRFDKLVADLKSVSGTSVSSDAERADIIYSAFVGTVADSNSKVPAAKVQLDSIGQKSLEQDIRDALAKELESSSVKLEKMSPKHLEDALEGTVSLLNLQWVEKVPGLKEYANQLKEYTPLIQWLVGAIVISKLEKLWYYVHFSNPKSIKVISRDQKIQDEQEVELKLNAHIQKNPSLARALQIGSLYSQPSFSKYRESVTDVDGKILDPNSASYKSYIEYLGKKPKSELTFQEQTFLRTAWNYDLHADFWSILSQNKDYARTFAMYEQLIAGNPLDIPQNPSSPTPPQTPDAWMTSPPPPSWTSASGGISSIGWWVGTAIGTVAGWAGKILGTGASWGMRILGETFSEAVKHGWALWGVAVIWALIWSIWKGPGFWGTLGAIFGLGVVDSAMKGEISLPKSASSSPPNTPPATPPNTPPATPPNTPPATPSAAETPQRNMTSHAFMARALGRNDIFEANIDVEKAFVDVLKWVNYLLLVDVFTQSDNTQAVVNLKKEIKYDTLSSADKERIDKVIDPANTASYDTFRKIIAHLQHNQHVTALTPEERQQKTLTQMIDHVVSKENEKKKEAEAFDPNGMDAQKVAGKNPEIFTLSEWHSHLYLLSRLIMKGYIPQLSDNTIASIREQKWAWSKLWWGMKYLLWDGGPLTNNKDSKNPLVWAWHKWLSDKVAWFTTEVAKDEKWMITEALAAMKGKNIDSKALIEAELLERKWKVDAIETALKKQPLDLKWLQSAMADYEKSVKTKWEIIGNKLGMKWGENKWNLFKWTSEHAYIDKANRILIDEKAYRSFWPMSVDQFQTMYDTYKKWDVSNMIYQSGDDGKWYQVVDKNWTGSYKVQQINIDPDGKVIGTVWNIQSKSADTIVKGINTWIQKMPDAVEKIKSEALELWEGLDKKKQSVFTAFEAWEADTKNADKKKAAMAALEEYNKLIIETNGKVSEKFALLTEAEAKALWAKTKSGWWLSEFIHTNTTGSNFWWVDKVDKLTAETSYLKWARRGFVGVGLLTMTYHAGKWFWDLVKDWDYGNALTRMFDLGIGMVPFAGAIHDIAILTSDDYEKWILGAKMSEKERAMRAAMVGIWLIPGVGMAIKGGGNLVKSSTLLATGSGVFKTGNMIRSAATYSLLGMSLYQTTYEIKEKVNK